MTVPVDSRVIEALGDLIDPYEFHNDFYADMRQGGFHGRGMDRRNDKTSITHDLRTEADLQVMRNEARLYTEGFFAAIAALKNLTNYIIGTGFDFEVVSKNKGENEALKDVLQEFIDLVLEKNEFLGSLDREIFRRSRRDGESFVALFPASDNIPTLRIIHPDLVTEPENPRQLEDWLSKTNPASVANPSDWTFGVHTLEKDLQKVWGYFVGWDKHDWDYFAEAQMAHLTLNVDLGSKRGQSDFWAVRHHLINSEKILKNTASGTAIQAAIAYIREHSNSATASQVGSIRSSNQVFDVEQPTEGGGSITRRFAQYLPGTILDVPMGQKYLQAPIASGSSNFILVGQAVLRAIGSRWCMPEYMISGDASNANYASTLVAESPFVMNAKHEQNVYANYARCILWKAVDLAIKSGAFASFEIRSFLQLKKLVEIKVDVPPVEVRDNDKETDRRIRLVDASILSRRSAASQENLDYDQEQDQMDEEARTITPPMQFGESYP